jgi:methylated-DNA-[protein]-cysteine S-methyltransferase
VTLLHTTVPSPIGDLLLSGDETALRGLRMPPHRPAPGSRRSDATFAAVRDQLHAYFAGGREAFDLPLEMEGTTFQRRVWAALREIPFGATCSYGELAARIDRPGAARAVGLANGRNPIAVVVPCHRVIGADGSLTGFGGGLDRKRVLLEHEARIAAQSAVRHEGRGHGSGRCA